MNDEEKGKVLVELEETRVALDERRVVASRVGRILQNVGDCLVQNPAGLYFFGQAVPAFKGLEQIDNAINEYIQLETLCDLVKEIRDLSGKLGRLEERKREMGF